MAASTGSRAKTCLMTAGIIAALVLSSGAVYVAETRAPSSTTNLTEPQHNETVYHNSTVYNNRTVYQNTTNNITTPIWHNSTTYVNTTVYHNPTVYRNETVYVNTTVIYRIPVVNVTYIQLVFVNASVGVNQTLDLPQNYSLPVGTVTWLNFTANYTESEYENRALTVNEPWTLLSVTYSDWEHTPLEFDIKVLVGVPYWPGTYGMTVNIK